MSQIMLIYPPGRSFQRGEERCQVDIGSSAANSNRACNDIGYAAACLKKEGYSVFLRDYQVENANVDSLVNDIRNEHPDIIFISITNGSIFEDLKIVNLIKEIKPDTIIILKGALFFNPEDRLFNELNLDNVDYLIGGEQEFITAPLINAHYKNKEALKDIQGISYKINGKWNNNFQTNFVDDLDSLPFPDRSLMRNELYINPETNKPMALITTAKGCCYNCKYCLSPVISGKKVRERSAVSIFKEIEECVNKYNITNFFFKSDTFTVNRNKVIELCNLITAHGLNKKINWVATARVDTLDEELITKMKESGCSLLAIGFESGSNESLKLMLKNTTKEQNKTTAMLCKKHGIKILGYFLIGFSWENESHLEEVKKHIFDIDADYIEISVVVPFYRTPLYEELIKNQQTLPDILGSDSYNHIYKKYSKLSPERLEKFKKQVLLSYYLRPKYIFGKLSSIKSIGVLFNYIKYGCRMLKNTFTH